MLLFLLFEVESLYQKEQLFVHFWQFCRTLMDDQHRFICSTKESATKVQKCGYKL